MVGFSQVGPGVNWTILFMSHPAVTDEDVEIQDEFARRQENRA